MEWIDPDAARTLTARYPALAPDWLAEAPARLLTRCDQLGLVATGPLPGATAGIVVGARMPSGAPVVLKTSVRQGAVDVEARWLQAHPGICPAVHSVDDGVLVMARAGGPEAGTTGDAALGAVLDVLAALGPAPDDVAPFDVAAKVRLALGWAGMADPARAGGLAEALGHLAPHLAALVDRGPRTWLHGDLNSKNMLWDGTSHDRLVVVDPLPAAGPLAVDAAYWATCPLRGPGALDRLGRLAGAGVASFDELVAFGALAASQHCFFQLALGTDRSLDTTALSVFDEVMGGATGLLGPTGTL